MKKSLLIAAAALALCQATPASAKDLAVVASFTVLADMVHEIGGNHVTVRSLVGPNGDPHVYEPTPADGAALAHADLVFVSGLGLEGWMDRLISASGYKGKIVVASDGIGSRTMIDADDDDDAKAPDKAAGGGAAGKVITDPHAWNSVANAVIYATNVEKAFEAADPADAGLFKTNGDRYIGELTTLDAWVHQQISEVPAARRKVITTHDAFGYFGAAYGVEFRAPIGFSSEGRGRSLGPAGGGADRPDPQGADQGGVPRKRQRSPSDPADRRGDRCQTGRDSLCGGALRRGRPGPQLREDDPLQRRAAQGRHADQLTRRHSVRPDGPRWRGAPDRQAPSAASTRPSGPASGSSRPGSTATIRLSGDRPRKPCRESRAEKAAPRKPRRESRAEKAVDSPFGRRAVSCP